MEIEKKGGEKKTKQNPITLAFFFALLAFLIQSFSHLSIISSYKNDGNPLPNPPFPLTTQGPHSTHKNKPLYHNPFTNPLELIGKQISITHSHGLTKRMASTFNKLEEYKYDYH
jgi:hypothetical protein